MHLLTKVSNVLAGALNLSNRGVKTRNSREMFYLLDDIHYAEYYITRAETIDKGISIIIAIGTSATIASWGIFKNFSIVWGLIVGVAQLLIAIKPFLSFNTNSKCFREYIISASQLFCDFENDYFDVMEDILTPAVVNKKICAMRTYTLERYVHRITSESHNGHHSNGKIILKPIYIIIR